MIVLVLTAGLSGAAQGTRYYQPSGISQSNQVQQCKQQIFALCEKIEVLIKCYGNMKWGVIILTWWYLSLGLELRKSEQGMLILKDE